MDQKELDDAYDQAVYAPKPRSFTSGGRPTARRCAQRLGAPKRLAYGPTPIERLDIYTTKRPNAPIKVFIHGGAWRVRRGLGVLLRGRAVRATPARISSCPTSSMSIKAGGSLMPMAEQVRRAVAWVYKNAASFGGDPNRIYVSGHSSGAHLAGMTLITDWRRTSACRPTSSRARCCAPACTISSRCGCRSARAYVKFTDEMEERCRTQRHLDTLNCPVIVAYGTYETPEFQRQSARLRRGA